MFKNSDIKIVTEAQSEEKDDRQGYWSTDIPKDYNDFRLEFTQIEINIKAINFLLTKNLFGLSEAIQVADGKDMMMTPYDVLLVGNKR